MRVLPFVLAVFLSCGCSMRVVNPGESGLMWRPFTSGLDPAPLPPGTHIYPAWDDVISYSLQLASFRERVVVLSQDDLKIEVSASAIVRPIPDEIALLEQQIGADWYPKVVQPKFRTSIRNVLANYTMHQISKSTSQIEQQLLEILRARLEGQHIEVQDVILDDVKFSAIVLQAVEVKLAKEQEQEQMRFELNIARKDAEIALIKAKAEAEAIRMKAKAQAEAQEIISKKLTPRYLQFKALESPASKYFFLPQGKDGLPVMIQAED